jgi:hypothetical protein
MPDSIREYGLRGELGVQTYCCIWPDFCASYARTRSSSDERSRLARRLGAFFAAAYDDSGQSGRSSTMSRFIVSDLHGESGHTQPGDCKKRMDSACRIRTSNDTVLSKVGCATCSEDLRVNARIRRGRGRVVGATSIYEHQG